MVGWPGLRYSEAPAWRTGASEYYSAGYSPPRNVAALQEKVVRGVVVADDDEVVERFLGEIAAAKAGATTNTN